MKSLFNIAEICVLKNISQAVISPGSRSAPLTISLARHPKISRTVIPDERSAGFIALGKAMQTGETVVLVCTSGTASYNYAPAIAEAFYQQIPLLILTADRPPEWIGQSDGQTIRQNHLYQNHVKGFFSLPAETEHPDQQWHFERILSEAINLTQEFPPGPVHINVPIREPFYPKKEIKFSSPDHLIHLTSGETRITEHEFDFLNKELQTFEKVVIVAGQGKPSKGLKDVLSRFCKRQNAVLISDIISNTFTIHHTITQHDLFLNPLEKELTPDLLISFGLSVVSKNLKLFLRNNRPRQHWHIQPAGMASDTFQSLSRLVRCEPEVFFRQKFDPKSRTVFLKKWKSKEKITQSRKETFFDSSKAFSELHAIKFILNLLPENSILHLGNSMPVRYANYLGIKKKNIEVYSNRGTSGIDGVISTAYGQALSTSKTVTVISGDMTFFYDRNAFWNNYLPENLRIVILNNHGGGIFRMIDGSSQQPELEEYFETNQPLIAEGLAHEFDLDYYFCKDVVYLQKYLTDFFQPGNAKILEIETDSQSNTLTFKTFKRYITHGKQV